MQSYQFNDPTSDRAGHRPVQSHTEESMFKYLLIHGDHHSFANASVQIQSNGRKLWRHIHYA